MAITVVLGWDLRICAGGNYHEEIRVGPMFALGITSSNALQQLVHDLLLNTEALGGLAGVTAANVNVSPHAASIRRAWHESWALCHETSSLQQWTPSDLSWSNPPSPRRSSRWRHRTNYARLSRRTIHENCSTRTARQANGTGPRSSLFETREPSHVDAVDSDHKRKGAHGALGEERPTIQFQRGIFDPDVLGRCPTN